MTNEEAINILSNFTIVLPKDCTGVNIPNKFNEAYLLAIKALENAPLFMVKADGTIEPIMKTGKWKIYKSPVNRYYQCSCCGKNSPDFTAYMKMNYCPNCGAKMEV